MAQVVLEVTVILEAVDKALRALEAEQDNDPAWAVQQQALTQIKQAAGWTISTGISDSLHVALTLEEIHLLEPYLLKRR